MKIRNRLTLLSTLVFGIVFSFASFLVYFIFMISSEKVIYNGLEKSSRLTSYFYLEEDELSSKEHSKVEAEFQEIIQFNTTVMVYDEENNIRYGQREGDSTITASILDKVRKEKRVTIKEGDYYYLGIFYPDNQGDFVVFVKENVEMFQVQTKRLLMILFGVLTFGLITIFIISKALSGIAYKPINNIIREVNALDMASLNKSLTTPNTKDEVQALVNTFNNLLKRLSDAFIVQKNFVNFISHELKTPLASIGGNLEVFAQRQNRSAEEHAQVTKEVVNNVHQIKSILNTLMELSGLRNDKIRSDSFRMDELIWEILERRHNSSYKNILVDINVPPEKSSLLNVNGDAKQIEIAVSNLIENAIKYSDGKNVEIVLYVEDEQLKLLIKDEGRGILPEELNNLNRPFYRGSNVEEVKGSGIGFSIAAIIFQRNNISIQIDSKINQGTSITLVFPNSNPVLI